MQAPTMLAHQPSYLLSQFFEPLLSLVFDAGFLFSHPLHLVLVSLSVLHFFALFPELTHPVSLPGHQRLSYLEIYGFVRLLFPQRLLLLAFPHMHPVCDVGMRQKKKM